MAANLIAATGSWGAAAETSIGVIITGLTEKTRCEWNYLKNEVGERSGVSGYDESIEVELEGKLTASSPFSTKLGANISLANTIAANSLYNANQGRTMVKEVERSRSNEDWRGVKFGAEVVLF